MNKHIKGIIISFFLCCVSALQAQKMSVESFNRIDRDMGARVAKVRDVNSELCALIKIETIETGFEFSGCSIEKTEQKTGEIWVFVSPGVRFLTIKHKEFGVLRNYQFPQTIESGVVYQMKLNAEGKEIKIDTSTINRAVDSKLDELLQRKLSGMDLGTNVQPVVITMQQIGDKGKKTNNHEYVDLGLSVKWAACNIGSTSPEILGSYYSWGETDTKKRYNKGNVQNNAGNAKDISSNKKYDVSRKLWGEPWRLPTAEEMKELCDSCTWQWASLNGMNGYRVIGPNGNSIFLPTAGLYNDLNVEDGGKQGYYWASQKTSNDSAEAVYLHINNDKYMVLDTAAFYGMNIRPVLGNYKRYNFATLNYANSFVPMQSSYGISVGTVKKNLGFYATVMTNFNFAGFGSYEISIAEGQENAGFYTGEQTISRFSANAGILIGKAGIYLKAGAGYGFRTMLWQMTDENRAIYESESYNGLEVNAGVLFIINRLALSADVVMPISNIGSYCEARIGIGINF